MNLMPEIAKMLGVETWEEFRIKDARGKDDTAYRLTDTSLEYFDEAMTNWCGSGRFIDLINGTAEVIKKPFKPKEGEWYYLFMFCGGDFCVASTEFSKYNVQDLTNAYCGNCFRTKEEAINHKAEIYEKLTGKKWEE